MMNNPNAIVSGRYSHDLMLHDTDEDLVAGTVAFVTQGLASGGQVLVHSSEERVGLLRQALGTHPRLEYGLDRDLYLSPTSTLFAYERQLAESTDAAELWVAGTVPFGADQTEHPAWARYESLVNEVLGPYAFHALCTYDTRTLPASTLEAARLTHPCLSTGADRVESADYLHPADFLTDPRAEVPEPPAWAPAATATLLDVADLRHARHLVSGIGASSSAVARATIDGFVLALSEVLLNGLRHGSPPVELTVWAETSKLTCLVTDGGAGVANRLSGYRYPEPDGPRGLWVARQLCEELIIGNTRVGGGSVLLATS
jgi:anti-sigma regulatory factor (Ser/Thr protein kinase)